MAKMESQHTKAQAYYKRKAEEASMVRLALLALIFLRIHILSCCKTENYFETQSNV